ncbi:FxsA family protein [Luteococcus sp. Sow4_B9]|uniref:FxsA family protein n=1 Tax=Luteococcus sp. Sow4_B9 TaxID=3438792 RepID=UPI003F9A33CA
MADSRRPVWASPTIFVLLVAMPILEVWVLLQVGRAIGGLPTIAILVLEAVLGAWLMRREGARTITALKQTLRAGRMPTSELSDAVLVLVGGLLLMLPGFVTDVGGFVLLLPWTRPLARRLLDRWAAAKLERQGIAMDLLRARTDPRMTIDGEVIPGHVVDAEESTHARNASTGEGSRRDDGPEPPAISGTVL